MGYLGIPFGIGVSLSDMWNWYLNRLKNKLFNWRNTFLSLAGKIQVTNKIFLATHIYYSSCWMPSKKGYEDLIKIIHRFIWAKWDHNLYPLHGFNVSKLNTKVSWDSLIQECKGFVWLPNGLQELSMGMKHGRFLYKITLILLLLRANGSM